MPSTPPTTLRHSHCSIRRWSHQRNRGTHPHARLKWPRCLSLFGAFTETPFRLPLPLMVREAGTSIKRDDNDNNGYSVANSRTMSAAQQLALGPNWLKSPCLTWTRSRLTWQDGNCVSCGCKLPQGKMYGVKAQQDDLEDWSRSLQHQVTAN